jgi:hypothetical protein
MSMGPLLLMNGLAMVLFPVILARLQGCKTDDDFIRWLAGKSLATTLAYRYSMISGFLIAGFGALLSATS